MITTNNTDRLRQLQHLKEMRELLLNMEADADTIEKIDDMIEARSPSTIARKQYITEYFVHLETLKKLGDEERPQWLTIFSHLTHMRCLVERIHEHS